MASFLFCVESHFRPAVHPLSGSLRCSRLPAAKPYCTVWISRSIMLPEG